MNITSEKLSKAIVCPLERALKWKPFIDDAAERFKINTPMRMAHFIAQCAHESNGFAVLEENLNYSADGLIATFPKHFQMEMVMRYAHHPDTIANHIYANRNGNGDEASGDGFRYKGRGLIQVTGKNNYKDCGAALGVDLLGEPGKLAQPIYAALSAGWFWQSRACNELADDDNILAITKKINGGTNGLEDRQRRLQIAKASLCV